VMAAVGTVHLVGAHLTANLTAYHAAFLMAAGFALIASILALTIKDSDAAATMVRRRRAVPEPESEPESKLAIVS